MFNNYSQYSLTNWVSIMHSLSFDQVRYPASSDISRHICLYVPLINETVNICRLPHSIKFILTSVHWVTICPRYFYGLEGWGKVVYITKAPQQFGRSCYQRTDKDLVVTVVEEFGKLGNKTRCTFWKDILTCICLHIWYLIRSRILLLGFERLGFIYLPSDGFLCFNKNISRVSQSNEQDSLALTKIMTDSFVVISI